MGDIMNANDSLNAVVVPSLSELQDRRTAATDLYIDGYLSRAMWTRITNQIESQIDKILGV